MKRNDKQLWTLLKKGEKNAFNEIYYQYVNIIYNYCKKIVNDEPLIEDCIQELFSDIWIKRNKLAHTDHIRAYLLVAIKRRLFRKLSYKMKHIRFQPAVDFQIELSQEEKLVMAEDESWYQGELNELIDNLTPRQKEIIHLKYYENLTYQEIAELMEIEVKAVYKLMGRAIKHLREKLK
ncbi:MAG: RNA polymerase sigma factor [Candidatus Cyclobacteriaceae bacterium M3_2C_046]